jgi:hypothetical protein
MTKRLAALAALLALLAGGCSAKAQTAGITACRRGEQSRGSHTKKDLAISSRAPIGDDQSKDMTPRSSPRSSSRRPRRTLSSATSTYYATTPRSRRSQRGAAKRPPPTYGGKGPSISGCLATAEGDLYGSSTDPEGNTDGGGRWPTFFPRSRTRAKSSSGLKRKIENRRAPNAPKNIRHIIDGGGSFPNASGM